MLTWLAETPLERQTEQAVEPIAGHVSSKIDYRWDDENCEFWTTSPRDTPSDNM